MHLNTQIIAKSSTQLTKTLKCSFDHPYRVIEDTSKSSMYSLERNIDKIIMNALESQLSSKDQNICFITFNITFQSILVQKLADKLGSGWNINLYEFDPSIGVIKQLHSTEQDKLQLNNYNATYILQLSKSDEQIIRLYFLPIRSPTQPNSNSRAIQQSFKLFRVLKSYLSLEHQSEESLQLSDNICLHLSEYLYMKEVSRINFILKLSEDEIDKRILEKVGEIKLPQEWLQKEEYRKKKQQIYCLQRDQQLMLKNNKKNKSQMLYSINEIRKLIGLKQDKYEDISVQSLRKLKAEGLNQKVAQMKELEAIRLGLDVRLKDLQNRRKICEDKKSELKKIQVKQILNLKNEVLTLQAQQPSPKYSGTQRLIYNRSKPAVQTRLITTIFSRANKKVDDLSQENLSMNRNTIDKTTHRYESELEKQNKRRQAEFKFAEKKVATVIKEGSSHQQLDIFKIREEYQNQIINIDFQTEKKLLAQQNRYQKATAALQKLLDLNQDLNLESL